jgi:hypothetical protein
MISIDEKAFTDLIRMAVREELKAYFNKPLPDTTEQSEAIALEVNRPLKYEDFMDKLRTHLREQDDTAAATKAAKNIMFEMFECEKFNQVEQEDLASLLEAITNG